MLRVGSRRAVRGQGLTDVSLVLVVARDVHRTRKIVALTWGFVHVRECRRVESGQRGWTG